MADYDLVIRNATIVDGTRAPRFHADVAIRWNADARSGYDRRGLGTDGKVLPERHIRAGGRSELRNGRHVVLAIIERSKVEVGGLPAQEWLLRVTLVYRRDGSEWRLAHRHADPLVVGVSHATAAALARGEIK